MNKRSYWLVLLGGLAALLLAGVGCQTDIKPVEDRVGAVEQNVAAAQTKLTSLEGKAGAAEQNLIAAQAKLTSLEGKAGKIAAPAGKVEFVVTGVELKGSTVTKDLAVPPVDPKTLSDGYRYKEPGVADKADATKWEVSTYVWAPGAMTALQGDQVSARIFIVNGDKHTTWIEGPDGKEIVKEEVQNRGREYVMTFTASQVGNYKLVCNEHDPTMRAVITVLPRS
jgi:plastocyanin